MSGETLTLFEAAETGRVPPGYKQTEVGVILEDWEVRPLLSTLSLPVGQVDPKIEPYKSMVLVAPDHIESHTGRLLKRVTASAQNAISGKYPFDADDIIYSKIRPYLRKVILADFSGLCSADMYPLSAAEDVSSGFMFAILLGERFSQFADSSSARSGIPKINRDELSGFKVALPPLRERRAIAATLSDVDALISSLDRLISKKRAVKTAAMQQLLTGKRRLPGFEEREFKQTKLGMVPKDWKVRHISEVADVKTGPFGSSLHESDYVPSGTPIITVEHLGEFGIVHKNLPLVSESDKNRLTSYSLRQNDIVFSRVGSIDRSSLVRDVVEGWLFSGRLLRVRVTSPFAYSPYLGYYFDSESFKVRIRSVAVGQTMPSLNTQILKSTSIVLPLLEEQTAIATVLSDMDAEIGALEARREKTRRIKQGMMQELLTGRTRLV